MQKNDSRQRAGIIIDKLLFRLSKHFLDLGQVAFAQDYAAAKDATKEGPDYEGLGPAVGGLGRDGDGLDYSEDRRVFLHLHLGLFQLLGHF